MVILYGEYPNYFGYHSNFGIISEPISDANKLYAMVDHFHEGSLSV